MSGVTTASVLVGAGLAATAATTAYSLFGQKGGGGATPGMASPPRAPQLEDPSIAAAAALQSSAAAQAKGRQSTILTSGMGDTSSVTTNKKLLLGS